MRSRPPRVGPIIVHSALQLHTGAVECYGCTGCSARRPQYPLAAVSTRSRQLHSRSVPPAGPGARRAAWVSSSDQQQRPHAQASSMQLIPCHPQPCLAYSHRGAVQSPAASSAAVPRPHGHQDQCPCNNGTALTVSWSSTLCWVHPRPHLHACPLVQSSLREPLPGPRRSSATCASRPTSSRSRRCMTTSTARTSWQPLRPEGRAGVRSARQLALRPAGRDGAGGSGGPRAVRA